MKSILITGGAGFIGSSLVHRFMNDEEYQVFVIDDLSTGKASNISGFLGNPRFKFISCSMHDQLTLKKVVDSCDFVFHLAS